MIPQYKNCVSVVVLLLLLHSEQECNPVEYVFVLFTLHQDERMSDRSQLDHRMVVFKRKFRWSHDDEYTGRDLIDATGT